MNQPSKVLSRLLKTPFRFNPLRQNFHARLQSHLPSPRNPLTLARFLTLPPTPTTSLSLTNSPPPSWYPKTQLRKPTISIRSRNPNDGHKFTISCLSVRLRLIGRLIHDDSACRHSTWAHTQRFGGPRTRLSVPYALCYAPTSSSMFLSSSSSGVL